MEDPELPVSPRKKPKLQEPSYVPKRADTVTEVPSFPEVAPHHHSATTENQLTQPATMSSAYTPSYSQTPTATATVSMAPIARPDFEKDGPSVHFVAAQYFYQEMAKNASKVGSNTTGVANALDEIGGKEAACGITEFVSPELLCFSGILKKRYAFRILFIPTLANLHRYTDFLVNEILPSGEVVHLDNLKAPPKPRKNAELFGDNSNPSPANSTEQKAVATERTERKVKEQEQSYVSKDVSQATPHPDTSNEERTIVKPKADLSAIGASQAIPQSMQGFDQHEPTSPSVENQEKISPHKRIPPPAPSIPLSMQDVDGKQPEPKQEKTIRRKEKVHIRQTSQGWVEFDKEKEDEIKKRKAEEDAAAGIQAEDATQMEDTKPEVSKDVPDSKELDQEQTPRESTQASWQAFAGSAPSSSFQVSSQPS